MPLEYHRNATNRTRSVLPLPRVHYFVTGPKLRIWCRHPSWQWQWPRCLSGRVSHVALPRLFMRRGQWQIAISVAPVHDVRSRRLKTCRDLTRTAPIPGQRNGEYIRVSQIMTICTESGVTTRAVHGQECGQNASPVDKHTAQAKLREPLDKQPYRPN
jgi:hypothetical protein